MSRDEPAGSDFTSKAPVCLVFANAWSPPGTGHRGPESLTAPGSLDSDFIGCTSRSPMTRFAVDRNVSKDREGLGFRDETLDRSQRLASSACRILRPASRMPDRFGHGRAEDTGRSAASNRVTPASSNFGRRKPRFQRTVVPVQTCRPNAARETRSSTLRREGAESFRHPAARIVFPQRRVVRVRWRSTLPPGVSVFQGTRASCWTRAGRAVEPSRRSFGSKPALSVRLFRPAGQPTDAEDLEFLCRRPSGVR